MRAARWEWAATWKWRRQDDPEDRNLEKAKGMLDKNGTHSQSAQFDVGVHPTFMNPDPGRHEDPHPGSEGGNGYLRSL
jgi:hypothetical protein